MVLVRAVTPDDWRALRDMRLAALLAAPEAFGSTYAQAVEFTEADWRRRAASGVLFFAYLPEAVSTEPAGMAGGYREAPGVTELVSMWVCPQARGRNVGEALVDAVADWALSQGSIAVELWVTETNKPAVRLYERLGFTATGDRQPLPSNPGLAEIRMTRPLDAS